MCIRDRGEGDGVALDDLSAGLVLARDLDDDVLLGIVVRNDTGDLAHDGHALGTAALEQLLDTGKTPVSYTHLCLPAG